MNLPAKRKNKILAFIICFLLQKIALPQYKYCVPVSRFDLNPFREINDGKEMAYLTLLLRSYISEDLSNPAILKAFWFSPDGTTFRATVDTSAAWQNGENITPEEAAIGIALGFSFRPIGQKIKVKGITRAFNPKNPTYNNTGIKLIDKHTFELTFESNISNTSGVIREALSTGSRHNRVWPINLKTFPKSIETLGKYPILNKKNEVQFKVDKYWVLLSKKQDCDSADFTLYPEAITKFSKDEFDWKKNKDPQSIILQNNTSLLPLSSRKILNNWIKSAFQRLPSDSGIVTVSSFIESRGSESQSSYKKEIVSSYSELKKIPLTIGVEIPIFKKALEMAAKDDGIFIKFEDLPLSHANIHAQLLSSKIHEGRPLILQDILNWKFVDLLLKNAAETKRSLKDLAKTSHVTYPNENNLMLTFEKAALLEQSLVPIGQRYVLAYSKKNTPIYLDWSPTMELVFLPRK